MSPIAAFALGGLTACTLIRIAISISRHTEEHQTNHNHGRDRKDHS